MIFKRHISQSCARERIECIVFEAPDSAYSVPNRIAASMPFLDSLRVGHGLQSRSYRKRCRARLRFGIRAGSKACCMSQ